VKKGGINWEKGFHSTARWGLIERKKKVLATNGEHRDGLKKEEKKPFSGVELPRRISKKRFGARGGRGSRSSVSNLRTFRRIGEKKLRRGEEGVVVRKGGALRGEHPIFLQDSGSRRGYEEGGSRSIYML